MGEGRIKTARAGKGAGGIERRRTERTHLAGHSTASAPIGLGRGVEIDLALVAIFGKDADVLRLVGARPAIHDLGFRVQMFCVW